MADKKISQLNSAGALAGTEVLPIVQAGETKKLALNNITVIGTLSALTVSNSIAVNGVSLSTAAPSSPAVGRLIWDDQDGTAHLRLKGGVVDLAIGQEQLVRVYNDTGSPLSVGQVVYVTGASGQRVTVALANAVSEATSTDTIGVVTEAISNNQQGFVRTSGLIKGLNTFAFNEGDQLYLSDATPGAITNVRPTQPSHGVRIGYCVKKNNTDGWVFLAINNGYELDELHDVLITTPAAGQILRRNAGNTLWTNQAAPTSANTPSTIVERDASGNFSAGTITSNLNSLLIELTEDAVPAAPAANKVRLFAEDNGSGKTRLMARFATGATVQIAIEP